MNPNRKRFSTRDKNSKKKVVLSNTIDLYSEARERKDYNFILSEDYVGVENKYKTYQEPERYVPFILKHQAFLKSLYGMFITVGIHARIIRDKVAYISGSGFTVLKNKFSILSNDSKPEKATEEEVRLLSNYVNSDLSGEGDNLHDLLKKVALDLKVFGNAYVELRKVTRENRPFLAVKKLPVQNCLRVYHSRTEVPTVAISNLFTDGSKAVSAGALELPIYPIFAQNEGVEKSILHIKQDTPLNYYYGMPDYIAAKLDIELAYRGKKVNQSKYKNGFRPSAIVQIKGDYTPEEAQIIMDDLTQNLTDTGNDSKLFAHISSDKDADISVQLLTDSQEGDFLKLSEMNKRDVLIGHQWSEGLSGLPESGSLGNTDRLRQEGAIARKTSIEPDIKLLEARLLAPIVATSSDYMLGNWSELFLKIDSKIPVVEKVDLNNILEQDELREIAGFAPLNNSNNE